MGRKKKIEPPPDLPNVPPEQREALSMWMKARIDEVETSARERIEVLRTVGEHPSPVMGKFVRAFSSLGLPPRYIASLCNSTVATIEKYYEEEMLRGKAETVAMVATNAIRIATSTDDPAASKVALAILDRMGGDEWKPPTKRVAMEEIEKPRTLDTSKLTYDQRQQLRELIQAAAGQAPQLTQEDSDDEAT